jgi:hypothetical protein
MPVASGVPPVCGTGVAARLGLQTGGTPVLVCTYRRCAPYERDYGFLRPVIPEVVGKFMGCGWIRQLGKSTQSIPFNRVRIFFTSRFFISTNSTRSLKTYEQLIDRGLLEIEALCYIRGRSIPNRFFVLDEAQQLTPLEAKTVVTRMSKGSKLVMVGDPALSGTLRDAIEEEGLQIGDGDAFLLHGVAVAQGLDEPLGVRGHWRSFAVKMRDFLRRTNRIERI